MLERLWSNRIFIHCLWEYKLKSSFGLSQSSIHVWVPFWTQINSIFVLLVCRNAAHSYLYCTGEAAAALRVWVVRPSHQARELRPSSRAGVAGEDEGEATCSVSDTGDVRSCGFAFAARPWTGIEWMCGTIPPSLALTVLDMVGPLWFR